MRLTLWQQFSSNHSTSYTLVGVFPTPEKAQQAAETWRQIIARVKTWIKNNPDKLPDDDRIPLEIEQELGKEYNMVWDVAADSWFDLDVKLIWGRFVMVYPNWQAEYGPQPLDQLMQRLGGKPIITGSNWDNPYGEIIVTINCDAPDDATLNALQSKTSIYDLGPFANHDDYKVTMYGKRASIEFYSDDFDDLIYVMKDLQKRKMTNIRLEIVNRQYTEFEPIEFESNEDDRDKTP
jgi:hypothetical protein